MKNITSGISGFFSKLLGDVGTVFYISVLIIAVFVAVAASRPEMVEQVAQQVLMPPPTTSAGSTFWPPAALLFSLLALPFPDSANFASVPMASRQNFLFPAGWR